MMPTHPNGLSCLLLDSEDKKKPKTSFFSNPVMGTVEGVREFAVESARLLNKCEKPDSKGLRLLFRHFFLRLMFAYFNLSFLNVSIVRIHEDCQGYLGRLPHHGLCRFSRQDHSHPDQQHPGTSDFILSKSTLRSHLPRCLYFSRTKVSRAIIGRIHICFLFDSDWQHASIIV
jgi:hypothetical protein